MRFRFRYIIPLLVIVVTNVASTTDVIEKQLQDYSVFNMTLLQKEGTLDLHVSRSEIERELTTLKSELQTRKSLLEQYKLFSSTLAKIQCGHTQIYPNKPVLREWLRERNSLPLDYYLVGKRLIVSKTDPADYKGIRLGKSYYEQKKKIPAKSEILSIDHLTVSEMMNHMGKYISSDENLEEFKYNQASHLFEFYRHMALPFSKDSIHVSYVTGKDTLSIYFQPGEAPVYTMNKRLLDVAHEAKLDMADIGKFKVIKGKYGYFRFKSFASGYGKDYDEFLLKSFTSLKKRKIDKLVIDLRGNMGGVMQYTFMKYIVGPDVELGKYTVEKPRSRKDSKYIKKFQIDYLKHRRMSKHQKKLIRRGRFNEGAIKTDKVDTNLIFKGEIVVITDEGTFSSASILACHLKTLSNAKIVGRPAGGSFYSGNAGTLVVKLPQSRFQLFVNPNTFYSQLPMADDPKEIKMPDVLLNPTYRSEQKMNAFYFKEATRAFD